MTVDLEHIPTQTTFVTPDEYRVATRQVAAHKKMCELYAEELTKL